VGIIYHNPDVPCYEEVRHAGKLRSPELIRNGLEAEFDKFTIWPSGWPPGSPGGIGSGGRPDARSATA
jgi:2-oxoglutarate ferredoxin oxidoreductase subunit beta